MPLSWIVKTIPRSPRALFMLVVALGSLAMIFLGLQNLFVPNHGTNMQTVMLIAAGAALTVPSVVLFYYFQTLDDHNRHSRHERELAGQQRAFKLNRAKR
jgi:hypothetical protein